MEFAFSVVDTVRAEEPELFDDELAEQVTAMIEEAVEAELAFAARPVRRRPARHERRPTCAPYLEYVADQRLVRLGLPVRYGTANPFAFMELQDVQELANFFERRVSAYQVGGRGDRHPRRGLLISW